jgi:putative membrane protein
MSDMFCTQSAKMAEQKGDSTEQSFARQVVLDHTKAMNALTTMVNTGKVNANLPSTLDGGHQQKLAELQNLWGQSFDNAYSRDLLQRDQNEISLFDIMLDNATLRQWATKMLPELRSHLVYAQTLSSEVHPGSAREDWQYDGAT